MIDYFAPTAGAPWAGWAQVLGPVGAAFSLLALGAIITIVRVTNKKPANKYLISFVIAVSLLGAAAMVAAPIFSKESWNAKRVEAIAAYEKQLTENADLVDVDENTVAGLGLLARGVESWPEARVGALLGDEPTTVYWETDAGELEFAQVVSRFVDTDTVELVVVSGESIITLQDYRSAN